MVSRFVAKSANLLSVGEHLADAAETTKSVGHPSAQGFPRLAQPHALAGHRDVVAGAARGAAVGADVGGLPGPPALPQHAPSRHPGRHLDLCRVPIMCLPVYVC